MHENHSSWEHSMSSVEFVSSRACVAALQCHMLTARMVTLSMGRCQGKVKYHIVTGLADMFL